MAKIRASLAKKPHEISLMFDEVAIKYDRVNSLFTMGFDRIWRKKMVKALTLSPDKRVLDIATGTAVSAAAIAKTGAWVVGIDFSFGMLKAADRDRGIPLLSADALALPFSHESFDAASIAFGLRNVVNPIDAAREIMRVLKPHGKLVILETSVPKNRYFKAIVHGLGYRFTKIIGKLTSSHAAAYSYLIDSVIAWPDAQALRQMLLNSGYARVDVKRLLGGVVAIHIAYKE